MIWYDERINKDKQTKNPRFALCCGDGKIQLPLLQHAPQPLRQLLFDTNGSQAKNFQQNIRSYNLMFAFTSPSVKVDKPIILEEVLLHSAYMVKGIILLEASYLCLITHRSLHNYIFMIQTMKSATSFPRIHKS